METLYSVFATFPAWIVEVIDGWIVIATTSALSNTLVTCGWRIRHHPWNVTCVWSCRLQRGTGSISAGLRAVEMWWNQNNTVISVTGFKLGFVFLTHISILRCLVFEFTCWKLRNMNMSAETGRTSRCSSYEDSFNKTSVHTFHHLWMKWSKSLSWDSQRTINKEYKDIFW